jgi:hypothetical protein
MSLVLAAHALGYGRQLGSPEWYAYDRRVLDALGLKDKREGRRLYHIGTPKHAPEDRPRPALRRDRHAI